MSTVLENQQMTELRNQQMLQLSAEQMSEQEQRRTEIEQTFDYDGYQVARRELFAHLRDPAIIIREDTTVVEKNKEEQPVNPRKGYYPEDIAGTFGVPVEQHRQESELRQMDGFVSVGMLTGIPGQQQNL